MKKSLTEYYQSFKKELIRITVNEDINLEYKPIKIEHFDRWWKPEEAIKYYENIIKCIKELQ